MSTLAEALTRALARHTRGTRGASRAAREGARLRRWARTADGEVRRVARSARISVEGRAGGGHGRWEAAILWTEAWRSEMEWAAAADCGGAPWSMESGDRALYERAREALAAIAGQAGREMKTALAQLAGGRWHAVVDRGLAEIARHGKDTRKHRWRTEHIVALARLRRHERARVLAEPPWLAEHLLADPRLRRAPRARWRGRAAARAAGAQASGTRGTTARAQAALDHWRARGSAPPLRAVWACAREGVPIDGDSAWAAATEAERRGAGPQACVRAVRAARARPRWLDEQVRSRAVEKIATACGLEGGAARDALAAMEAAWTGGGPTRGWRCTLWWRDDWAPLWWVPYECAAAVLAGAGRGTKTSSHEHAHRAQAMRELYLFTGELLTLDGSALTRKRNRRKGLDPNTRERAAAAFARLPARAQGAGWLTSDAE